MLAFSDGASHPAHPMAHSLGRPPVHPPMQAPAHPPAHQITGRTFFFNALVAQARLVLQAAETGPETASIGRFDFVPVKAPGLLTVPKEAEEANEAEAGC